MKKLLLQLPPARATNYPIIVGGELFSEIEKLIRTDFFHHRLVIITDRHVKKILGEELAQKLTQSGFEVLLFSFPAGEKYKNAKIKEQLEHQMLQHHCGRDTVILALGGGVVGDMAGFVAATYLRGIPYIQLPTTLLAIVDSSVGGKVGINTSHGKNLIGSFWQPSAVIADFTCLRTLPKKEWINGLMEVAKMFLTNNASQFDELQKCGAGILRGDLDALEKMVMAAVQIKSDVVQRDEKESGERMVLNFGHTIGHALEQVSHYKISHGVAVALGILVEMKISELLGILPAEDFCNVKDFFAQLEITPALFAKYDLSTILEATRSDKKTRAGVARYVLLRKLGEIDRTGGNVAHPVEEEVVKKALSIVAAGMCDSSAVPVRKQNQREEN